MYTFLLPVIHFILNITVQLPVLSNASCRLHISFHQAVEPLLWSKPLFISYLMLNKFNWHSKAYCKYWNLQFCSKTYPSGDKGKLPKYDLEQWGKVCNNVIHLVTQWAENTASASDILVHLSKYSWLIPIIIITVINTKPTIHATVHPLSLMLFWLETMKGF